jgi:hypothetical protein
MAELLLHKRKVESIFHLLGEHENDITYSVSWALAQSARFLAAFLHEVLGLRADLNKVVIRLQQVEKDAGVTDIEIESPGEFFVIVEAKRGWNLPGRNQLVKYAKRPSFVASKGIIRRLVVLSECSTEYALRHLGLNHIGSVGVIPLSWKTLASLAGKVRQGSSHAEKRLLRELLVYLRGLMTMQNHDSNWVYVVSLGPGSPKKATISWIDIVEKKRRYFHPVGGTWPKEPPNYIAFRYRGKLQSIHHVEGAKTLTNPHEEFSDIPSKKWKEPHFLYKLGRGFRPAHEVPMGNIYASGRVWCMLDTLFTSKTISQARDLSKRRDKGE